MPTPSRALRYIPDRHHAIAVQMARFGVVGVFGFVVDTATVYALRRVLGLYGAGVVAFLVAATANWAIHRAWTFRGLGDGPRHRQWVRFLAANSIGFVLNRGAYATLIALFAVVAANPVLATAAGAITSMGVNFTLSRRLVFR